MKRRADMTAEERLAASQADTRKQEAEKQFWIYGVPTRRAGKRVKGSRGRRIVAADVDDNVVQLLAGWYSKGTISEALYRAGTRFHTEFRAAHEPVLRAGDLARVKVDTSYKPRHSPEGGSNLASVTRLQEALARCGGLDSRTGSVMWHVVGLEWSIRDWSEQADQWGLDRKAVPGILLAALEMLAFFYGYQGKKKKG